MNNNENMIWIYGDSKYHSTGSSVTFTLRSNFCHILQVDPRMCYFKESVNRNGMNCLVSQKYAVIS